MLFSFYQPVQQQATQQRQQHNYVLQAGHLIGHDVRVNRGGHDSVEGVLVAIPGDYLVILTDDGICYVNGSHVKSITEGSKDGGKSNGGGSGGNRSDRGGRHKSFISAPNFQALLSRMRHKHIQINRGGPEKLDGFLAEISTDNALLIVDRELVRIPMFHIKNVCISTKNQNNKNNNNNDNNKNDNNKNDNNKNSNKNDNKNDNRNKNNKSGSSKSSGNKSSKNKSGSSKNRSGGSKKDGRNRNNGRR